jgi:hypothetical protein
MRRVHWPVWVLCSVLATVGALAFNAGVLFRSIIIDERTQAKGDAAMAMIKAFDLLKAHGGSLPSQQPLHFRVPQAFARADDTAGFTIQTLQAPTYLVLSDDGSMLLLLQQDTDGTNKQCLVHPARSQVGVCQLGRHPLPMSDHRGVNQATP